MFPLNLEDELVVNRLGRWQLEVVNLYRKVPATVLVRPLWKPGDEITEEEFCILQLDPDGKSDPLELTNREPHVIHWIIARPDFFDEVRKRHFPKDKVVAGAIVVTSETEAWLRPAKAREFQL